MKNYLSIVLLSLVMCLLFPACKRHNTQQQLLSKVENLQYDTIVAKPVDLSSGNRADSCRYRADNVLRRYPEMYHATDNAAKEYNTWLEKERDFIQKVFVGKDRKMNVTFKAHTAALDHRLQQLNFIEPLTAIFIDDADESCFRRTSLTTIPDEDAMKKSYRTIFLRICDGIKTSDNDYSSDEMRTACEKARLAWSNYITAVDELLETMPEECRATMQQAVRDIICLHAIDLCNCYVQYWTAERPGFVLDDNCQQGEYDAASYMALNMRPWLTPQKH